MTMIAYCFYYGIFCIVYALVSRDKREDAIHTSDICFFGEDWEKSVLIFPTFF